MSGPGAGKTRGGKKKMIHHKGGNRRFTDFEELKAQAVEIKNMKNRDEDSDEVSMIVLFKVLNKVVQFHPFSSFAEGTGAAGPAAAPPKKLPIAKKREDSSSDEESSDDGDEDDSDSDKHKGVEHLIEVENPNRVKQKMKKVTDLKLENTELSRKE
uniref:Uncharacterized protein n=1 Tax=Romanomermis culicivorax TaxID=13658 RepID=A0A915IJM6_ROMCU